jgi:predicted nucleic acid-binding protein
MRKRVLMDTGPLVATLNRRDRLHPWAKARLGEIEPPIFTCEPVLAEACFLLRDRPGGASALLELVERGVLQVEFQIPPHAKSLAALMTKYSTVPMSLADACLVRMTELNESNAVMTLDGDFLVYRLHGRQAIPVLKPPELAAAGRKK